jgi:benzoyl-CoA reductase/2-hydroxyglutaryl-CoA dehydratase subunit BcrC/BadD/HgdB
MRIIAKSQEACDLYRQIYEYRKRFPAHHYFQRQRLFMLPVAVMWNLDGCIKYYRKELKRLEKSYGALTSETEQKSRERYRLGWEGITIWYNVDLYYELLERGAGFVYETYTEALGMRKKKTHTFDETLRQIAREVLIGTYTLNLERRIEHWEQKIDEFDLDGVVLHANMSCRPSATALQDLKDALQKSRGVPVLILYGDMADPRAWADGPNQSRLDSFIEIMEGNRLAAGRRN